MAATKPQIPVGFAKVAFHGFLGPASWVNVFYVDVSDSTLEPGDTIMAIANWMHNFYFEGFTLGAFQANWRTVWQTITYRDAEDSIVRLRVADAMAGTSEGAVQDAQVAYLVNWSTGDPRRGGKPRSYVPGVRDASMQDTAFLDPTTVGAISENINEWLGTGLVQPVGMQLVEMSFRNGNTWRDAAHNYPIIGASLNPVVATQRRRVDRLRPS